MTGTEYLEGIKIADREINRKIEKLARLKALATKTTASADGERVQASGSMEQMADRTIEIIMLKQEINDEIDRFVDYKNSAIELLRRLHNRKYSEILYKRYIKYKSLYRIAKEKNADYENVKHLHKKALEKFDKETQDIVFAIDITPNI